MCAQRTFFRPKSNFLRPTLIRSIIKCCLKFTSRKIECDEVHKLDKFNLELVHHPRIITKSTLSRTFYNFRTCMKNVEKNFYLFEANVFFALIHNTFHKHIIICFYIFFVCFMHAHTKKKHTHTVNNYFDTSIEVYECCEYTRFNYTHTYKLACFQNSNHEWMKKCLPHPLFQELRLIRNGSIFICLSFGMECFKK